MEAFLLAPIQTILTDNGTEFDGEFARATADKDITTLLYSSELPATKRRQ